MKQFISLVSTLLLTLALYCVKTTAQTQGMYDVNISLSLDVNNIKNTITINRNVTIHKKVRFKIQTSLSHTTGYFKPEANATPILFSNGAIIEYEYVSDGDKTLLFYQQTQENPNIPPVITVSVSAVLKVKQAQAGVNYQSPDDIWTITTKQGFAPLCEAAAYPNGAPQKGFASVYIKYGSGHQGKLVRPIIFVDGVDFDTTTYTDPNKNNQVIRHGATGWDVLTLGLGDTPLDPDLENGQPDYEAFQAYPNAFQTLFANSGLNGNESYDFIFVDFSNGTDYIQRNSLLLQEVIRRVNQVKVPIGMKLYKNVVVGASMGGLVARHALASMEKQGENHCTHTYVSFDSPQKGANIPLSIQAMGWFFGATSDDPALKSNWEKLSTPAPRQLLINHFGNLAKNGSLSIEKFNWSEDFSTSISGDYACLRNEFVYEMTDLGYPKNARNIAISCGSTLGNALASQGYSAGSELFDMAFDADGQIAAVPFHFGRIAQAQLYASGNSTLDFATSFTGSYVLRKCGVAAISHLGMNLPTNNVLFSGAFPIGGKPCKFNAGLIRNNNPSGLNFDHLPGCQRRDLPSIKSLFKNKAQETSGVEFQLDEATYKRSFCFMPTMSTLDLNWEMTQTNLERAFQRDEVLSISPFKAIYAPDGIFDGGKNLKHVEISPSMVTWLQAEMLIGETAGSTVILPNNTAQQLVFSKNGIITNNHTVNANGAILLNGLPYILVGIGGCDTVQVNINSGGRFDIGSPTTIGTVNVKSNSTVRIANGGTLKVDNNGQLTIQSGAKLIIESGAILNLVGSTSKIIIQQGGELIVSGEINVTGNGHFQFFEGNIFTLNNNLILRGTARSNPLIRIAGGATILVNHPFEWRLENAAVIHEPGGGKRSSVDTTYIFIRKGATLKANNILFDDQQVTLFSPKTGTFIKVEDPFDVSNDLNDVDYGFDNCIFQNTGIAVELNVPYAQPDSNTINYRNVNLEFKNSIFTNCKALRADRSLTTLFENCTLIKSNIEISNTYLLNISGTTIRSNPPTEPLTNRMGGTAIKARETGHFWFRDGSLIDNWDTGIDDVQGAWNIIMTGSTIQKCGTGIILSGLLNNTTETGLLHMNCARLIQNDLGIKGQDVIFSTHARPSTTNVFTKNMDFPTSLFIESVFKDRQNIDTDLWLFGNYWGNTPPATTPVNTDWSFRVKTGSPQPQLLYVPWVGTINIARPGYPVLTDENNPIVQSCGGVAPRGGQEDPFSKNTIVNINGILYDVKIQQDAGMSRLNQNNLVAAQNLLSPVADIPNSIRDTASAAVKHFMSVSRALTLRSGVQLRSNSKSAWLPEAIVGTAPQSANTFFVSPNPTNDQITRQFGSLLAKK